MTKKIILPIIATALFITAVGLFIKKAEVANPTGQSSTANPNTIVRINDIDISVSLAKSQEEREKGLSGVSSLGTNSGMLFVFEDSQKAPTFWMKDTLIPLDIIWIKDDQIIRIDKNVPVPDKNTPDNKLPTYSAGSPVDYVLEVNAGFSDTNSIKVGDKVDLLGI